MKPIVLALIFASTITLHAEDFNRSITTSAAPHLSINTPSGYIHLTPGSANTVQITGHVSAQSGRFGGNANDHIHAIVSNPPIQQSGDTITIGRTDESVLFRNVTIDYDISVPAQSTIQAHSGSGDIRAHSLQGALTARTGSGDLQVRDIAGMLSLDTGSGSIHAQNIHGASLHSGSGDIEATQSAAGDLRILTGSGSIRVKNFTGALNASTSSGDIEAQGNLTSPSTATTGSGSIQLTLGNQARFQLEANTGSGSIRTTQSISSNGTHNGNHLNGPANGGGPELKLRTGSGDIDIR